ncbi:MAG: Asp-tRNA(Asn)/Glu-tRNA(Gln) amidotransferase subunit GatA [Patescibacteria group bacterium]
MKIDLKTITIRSAHDAFVKGDFTAVQLAQAYLDEIAAKNAKINAYLEVFSDVLDQAKAADVLIKEGKGSLLTGIPIAVKDNILIKGRRAGAASKILEGYVAPYDATAIARLKKEGVVFIGRTNMDEFAMGGSNENSAYGPVHNPHDESRVSGGSSGGSAAAVAMFGALAALGSDTGGSVRQPASLCGVVGFKPTYGAISRYGLMAMGSSLDQIGTIAKNADDAQILFDAMAGHDEHDSTTLPESAFNGIKSTAVSSAKKRIGIPRHFMKEGIDAEVLANFEAAVAQYKKLGYEIVEIELPNIEYSLAVYYVIMPAEASSNLSRFDGMKYGALKEGNDLLADYLRTRTEGFGKEVRRRIMMGNYILSSGYYDAYYAKANLVRDMIRVDFAEAFKKVDFILTPTSPVPAFKIGEKSADPLQMYLADIFTVTANLVGVPAISIPSGFVEKEEKQLPLGIQLMAPHKADATLFHCAKDFLA